MIEKPSSGGMLDFDALLNWSLLIGLSLWGGLASFMRKMRECHARAWNIAELIGELTIAGFTGVCVANLCDSMPKALMSEPLKYALVGVMAHMGSRALFKLESLANSKLNLPAEPASATGDDHVDK